METIRGGIYILTEEWKPYDEPIINHRPVIVLRKHDDYVEAVTIGVSFGTSRKESKIMIEYNISGKKYISPISCDVVEKIPIEYIKSRVGYVNASVVELIEAHSEKRDTKRIYKEEREKRESQDSKEPIKGITITDSEKMFEALRNVNENILVVKYMANEARKAKNVWKERLIGFVLGIIASVIASALWESRKIVQSINIIERITELFSQF